MYTKDDITKEEAKKVLQQWIGEALRNNIPPEKVNRFVHDKLEGAGASEEWDKREFKIPDYIGELKKIIDGEQT